VDTTLDINSRIQKWNSDYFVEYVRETPFSPYMGRYDGKSQMPIVANRDLVDAGKTVNIPRIDALDRKSGVRGDTRLIGREVRMGNYNFPITVNWNRNGVVVKKTQEHWTEMNLRDAARTVLKDWSSVVLRDDLICAMLAFGNGSILRGRHPDLSEDVPLLPDEFYAAASEAEKDAWLALNSDRVLFGRAVANNAANDHSVCLATIDNDASTGDRMTTGVMDLAKELARATTTSSTRPSIRPVKVDNTQGRENFVMFTNSRAFRALKRDDAMGRANREARPRDVGDNPLFQDGDLIWNGIIVREVPEIPVVSNGTIEVAPSFLCGAQAVAIAWGQDVNTAVKKEDDYGFEYGVAVQECRGVGKFHFNGIQHGMVTVWTAAVASA